MVGAAVVVGDLDTRNRHWCSCHYDNNSILCHREHCSSHEAVAGYELIPAELVTRLGGPLMALDSGWKHVWEVVEEVEEVEEEGEQQQP